MKSIIHNKLNYILIICLVAAISAMPFNSDGIAASEYTEINSYSDLVEAFQAASEGSDYISAELCRDIEIPLNDNELLLTGGQLTILGNNHSIKYSNSDDGNSGIDVQGGTLKLGDTLEDGSLVISGNNTEHAHPLVKVSSGSLYLCPGAELSGNINTGTGGGVYVASGATLYLNGGSIINNAAAEAGGVYLTDKNSLVYIIGEITIDGNTAGGKSENMYFAGSNSYNTSVLYVTGSLVGSHIGITMQNEKYNGRYQVTMFTQNYRANNSAHPNTVFYEDNPGFYVKWTNSGTEAMCYWNKIDVTVPNEINFCPTDPGTSDFTLTITNNSAYFKAYITAISCTCNDGWQLLPVDDARIINSMDGKLWGMQLDGVDLYSGTDSYSKRTIDKRSSVELSGKATFGSSVYGLSKCNIADIVLTISNS